VIQEFVKFGGGHTSMPSVEVGDEQHWAAIPNASRCKGEEEK
jgi:hypothetical protein